MSKADTSIIKVVGVQAAAIFLDKASITEKVRSLIRRASAQGAQIIDFPGGNAGSHTEQAVRKLMSLRPSLRPVLLCSGTGSMVWSIPVMQSCPDPSPFHNVLPGHAQDMADKQAKQDEVDLPKANLIVQNLTPLDEAQPIGDTGETALEVELKRLREKAFEHETFTEEEKIKLLNTRFLPYKALAAPERLTLEERYRLLMRPPPDEVAANILRITKGAYSTPQAMLHKAAKDAESLTIEELLLVTEGFMDLDGIYDGSRHLGWANKWREAGEAALEYISSDDEVDGVRQAAKVLFVTPGREEEHNGILNAKTAALGSDDKARERANEKSRQWELHDQKLLSEATASMDSLLQELLGNN